MFPGSKVARGKDWQWGDQDGGQGSEGEVIGYENVSPDSSRNLVLVRWSKTDVSNSYRLGFHGNVDLTCVEEEVGPFYYRDHLPVLGKLWEKKSTTLIFVVVDWLVGLFFYSELGGLACGQVMMALTY